MEESEKELLEILKNFDKTKLFKKQSYIELSINDKFYQAFILNEKNNQKYDIYIPNLDRNLEIPSNRMNFYGENDYTDDSKMRDLLINIELKRLDISEIINYIKQELSNFKITFNSKFNSNNNSNSLNKENSNNISITQSTNSCDENNKNMILDKNGKLIDITGYLLYQFLEGYILDCLNIISDAIEKECFSNSHKELFILILDITIYIAKIVKENVSKYKIAYYNRKLLIVSTIHAILICFDSLIFNLTPKYRYNYKPFSDLDQRFTDIANLAYQIILLSKNKNFIPLHSLIVFIKLLCLPQVKVRIDDYDQKEMYLILNEHMRNLDKNELIYFKKDSSMRQTCTELVSSLFNNNMETYIDETYYSYLLSCLKCNNLEKKMNALNDISDIINKFEGNREINEVFKDFIEKNNILDIFFEDSTHDEVIKRSNNLFKYLAKYNCLNDNIIEKIIQKQNSNDSMKKLLIEIISELPKEKKNILFNRLSRGIKLDDEKINNIDYISKLTESCLYSSNLNKINNEKEKDKEEQIDIDEEMNGNNYYGLNMIFDYIVKDFNDKKKYDENNVDTAINSFEHIINNILSCGIFKADDVVFFLEKLFHNIKNNPKRNSIIQSIKLIHKLLIILSKKKKGCMKNIIKKLDEKYDIFTLFINDLIRYMKQLPNDYSNENGKDNIYEGIYPHYINVETRLNLIFYFIKKNYNTNVFVLEGKKLLEKIYEVFKYKKFKEERKKFYEIITKNISQIDNILLMEFYEDIFKNKEIFDVKEINDNESINLVIQIFINYNKHSILNDGKKIRIEDGASIEGIDMLFDLLTQNPIDIIQEKVSQLLCDICLSHKNYNSVKISEYWRKYFEKINVYLDNIINSNDIIALNGIIKLINKIYTLSCECQGKIPEKSDFQGIKDSCKSYHFMKIDTKKEYQLKCKNNDKLISMRYKIGYYFDIPVNNVAFIDINGRIFTLNDDFEIFTKIFSDKIYFYEKGFEYVKVKEICFGLLKIKDNPKFLIETNDKIYNILINNLKMSVNDNKNNTENGDKQKIWNFISKLPKNYYFENKIKKLGEKEKVNNNEIIKIFNINEIYLLTYSLQCILYVLFDKNEEENEQINNNEFLNNFIEIQQGDKLIIDILFNMKIDQDNMNSIQIECVNVIIADLYELEKYKENQMKEGEGNILNDENLYNKLLKKLTEILSSLLRYNYDINKNSLIQDDSDISEDSFDEKEEMEKKIISLADNIFSFIDEICKNRISYMNFIFNDKELFIKIFINDFIKCENEELKKRIDEYLSINYEKNNENIKKYLEVILTVDIFNYLTENDKAGKYFHIISLMLKRNFDKKEIKETDNNESQIIIEPKHIKQAKNIIDLILNYIQKECNKTEEEEKKEYENIEEKELKKILKNKENFKEGMLLFLSNLLNINSKELVNYIIIKVDIFDFFLKKCILRKCVEKPLESKKPFCHNNQSKSAIYKLLLNILRNIDNEKNDNLYSKMIDILDNYNKIGFWKTFNIKNWEVDIKDAQKGKYVGLKNMTSTCYLNSIIQQLFMIPMFRETILKIENPFKDNVLYELQLLFSALKIYEFPSYSPKSFVIANKLNFYEQMDADEFYGSLIDKIENDIKKIYQKNPMEEESKVDEEHMHIEKNDTSKYKDIFNYFFGIKVLDELHFVDCGHKRYNEFCYNNIQLEIKDFTNMHDSLKNYFRTEVMDGDNKINCEQCNTKRTCHKHLLLKTLPNILVISLKRFEFDYDTMLKYKLNKYFEFPLALDLKDYLVENHKESNTEYELTGITIHFGVSEYGHYYDIIKGPDKWYKFNDTNVTEFKKEDIPKEAFGEKEYLSDDDSYKEKESGKNNAYILIYTKKENSINKLNNPYLAYPPYSKYSNVKKDFIDIINIKLNKSYIIKNIFSSSYQNFVMGLLKMDIAKIININIEKNHAQFIRIIRNEGYMKNIKDKETKSINNNNNDKIFQFGLRFYFNIILRLLRKSQEKSVHNNFERYKEIINIYIENDSNKARYILEEFSNANAIDEYLIYCPSAISTRDCIDIIINSFNVFLEDNNNILDENSIIYKYLNTVLTYISKNIRKANMDNINAIFYKIINSNTEKFLVYLKRKNLNKWLQIFFKKTNEQEILDLIFNETNLPTLHSSHSILSEKIYKFINNDNNYQKPKGDENDIYDQQFFNKLNEFKSNEGLIFELNNCLNKINC